MPQLNHPIAVTGIGIASPLGMDVEAFLEGLYAGKSGSNPSACLQGLVSRAFEIEDFDPQPWLGRKGIRALDRPGRLLSVAAALALRQAGWVGDEPWSRGVGLINGTVFGSVRSICAFDWSGLEDGPRFVNPMAFPNTVINAPAGQAAIKHRLSGINSTVSTGMTSGLTALACAAEHLRLDRTSRLLAGGCEELSREACLGFRANRLLSSDDSLVPYGCGPSGTVLGEGSALLALRRESDARGDGDEIWGLFRGYGESWDVGLRTGVPDVERAAATIEDALRQANVGPSEVGFLVLGACGVPAADALEVGALKRVFGDRLSTMPACAPKAALGESQGASGAFLAAAACLALRRKALPPTLCWGDCAAPLALSKDAQPLVAPLGLVTLFGVDGNAAAAVFSV